MEGFKCKFLNVIKLILTPINTLLNHCIIFTIFKWDQHRVSRCKLHAVMAPWQFPGSSEVTFGSYRTCLGSLSSFTCFSNLTQTLALSFSKLGLSSGYSSRILHPSFGWFSTGTPTLEPASAFSQHSILSHS